MSQDSILGKVKTLQRQLGKNIKFGQRPSNGIPMKKAGSTDASSEEDFFLTSPMEIVTQQDIVLSDTENKSSDTPSSSSPLNLPEAGSEMEEKVVPVKPSRPKRHFSSAGTIESVNLDAIPLAIARLDNSAAKHKLSVKPKNQRVSRKHRWLAQDRQNEPGSFESQSSLDQNGQPGEDKHIWHEEEPEPQDSHEEKRLQEEYWRELEAKCKRQKAEAAEKRRLEEQRRQALERRLWEESLRQELLEEEEEEEEEEGEQADLQLEAGKAHPGEGRPPALEEQGCAEQELEEADDPGRLEAEERRREQEEAERQAEKLRQREAERQAEKLRQHEAELQEEELRQREAERQAEKLRQREAELQEEELRQREAERQAEKLRQREAQRQEEELRQREAERQEEELRQRDGQRQEEELRQLEAQRQEEKLRQREAERQEELRQREAERLEGELRQREAERQEEKLRQLEAERQRAQEEEARRMLQESRQEEEEEEEEARRTEELKGREMDEGPQSPEGESQPGLADEADQQSPLQQRDLEKPEEQETPESAGQKEMAQEQTEEAKVASEPAGQRGDPDAESGGVDVEGGEATQTDIPLPQEGQMGGTPASEDRNEAVAADNDRKVEELRWQEVDERQTMPRPYTFQVSSGGRQILFPKVNLSPVTPAKDAASLAPVAQEPPVPRGGAPHALPSALSIPHTAILVTGAQLCGPAVNLSQIKDTACKSLLGLSEEKRPVDVPAVEPRAGGGKARPPPEAPSNAGALAEWASIRSRILKNTEGDQRGDREPARAAGDEPAPRARSDSRGNVHRTPPGNAKFSIMSAWQKFSDGGAETSKQSLDGESIRKKPGPAPGEETAPQPPPAAAPEPRKGLEKPEVSQEPPDTTDGCKFAKDLPSFLVPGLPSPQKAAFRTESTTTLDSETTSDVGKPDPVVPGGEEKASPFGIKLRRTNYSLRFHCDQQAEQKKKKRHSSTGDTVDGGTPAAGSDPGEKEPEAVTLKHGASLPQEKKPALAPRRDSPESPSVGRSVAVAQAGLPPASSQTPAPEQDKAASRTPPMQKPALAPKPASQTPPSSPLSKLSRPHLVELLARRAGKVDSQPSEACKESRESQESSDNQPPSPSLPEEPKGQKRDEEEVPEKKPASPPLPASQQERPSLTPETGRKEKPVLQSRHSVDGSRLAEKVETAQPLWITLALQKQKGFREQQVTREERKQAREAKQAEKLSKDTVSVSPQPGSSRVSRAGSLHKSATPSEEKKPETAVSRLQRREQLKKANTLPTSVTVEISDSAPPAPLVKEVTKRFSTPDAAPASTEPAWLALAKRKAKAWSDCPQIIK
ncbi:capping protein-inhibiting regulator of actin dynamics isoform X2 [Peromyscus californicus insignis]|uniref:capping protein-inhibiting regulator of actin dynamics isoform X2 n=1 Tax=Peromyscus californicus insignis TaxID=564181 RepID=UPI0022A68539|nr:capping protein-inhibiting regulator of actin dynamics isoform X2 [Peromyscus californicus insignis]XP_052591183.1 capping protein-inhibiting regulator of actin dynamics isoform X2 [Peromyscus californicus insignis]